MYNYLIATQGDTVILDELDKLATKNHHSHNEFTKMMEMPYMQLLAVLPPSSMGLIPPTFQAIVQDLNLGCVQYYPCVFDITTYLKTYLWECSAILPDINLKRIYQAYIRIPAAADKC
jgi:5'-3' exonuclease